MTTDEQRLMFLFERYVREICTEEEIDEFFRLVASTAHQQQIKSLMDEVWATPPAQKKLSGRKAYRILNTILAEEKGTAPVRRLALPVSMRAAAAVFVIAVLAGVLYQKASVLQTVPVAQSVAKEKIQPHLQHRLITLSDGSTVLLNHFSELDFPASFEGSATREVYLKGEGYFDIKHDPSKPFIVHTGKLRTTVLGTAFNIKAYREEKSITVTVTRGKVQVGNDRETFGIVTPNQQVIFNQSKNEIARKAVDASKEMAWQQGSIFFDDITIEGAVRQLEERFGVTIGVNNDKLKDCRFSASFIMGESLEEILLVICEFNQSLYKRDEAGNFIIEGEGC
jgi:transmembrane sensor